MSQSSETNSISDDEDCEISYLKPVPNQYNITDKIKEANQLLYTDSTQRQSSPKVRFRDHNLVDFEPEDGDDIMEKRAESSDDGYIDEECIETKPEVREQVEIEEVYDLENSDAKENIDVDADHDYIKEDFHDEEPQEVKLEEESTSADVPKKSKVSAWCDTTDEKIREELEHNDKQQCQMGKRSKLCCSYKDSDEYKQTLPKYNGLISKYGLSKDERSRREHIQTKVHQKNQFRAELQREQKEIMDKVNEEAFSKWLSDKMRHPVDKSNPINMFDVSAKPRKKFQRNAERI